MLIERAGARIRRGGVLGFGRGAYGVETPFRLARGSSRLERTDARVLAPDVRSLGDQVNPLPMDLTALSVHISYHRRTVHPLPPFICRRSLPLLPLPFSFALWTLLRYNYYPYFLLVSLALLLFAHRSPSPSFDATIPAHIGDS